MPLSVASGRSVGGGVSVDIYPSEHIHIRRTASLWGSYPSCAGSGRGRGSDCWTFRFRTFQTFQTLHRLGRRGWLAFSVAALWATVMVLNVTWQTKGGGVNR